MPGFNTVRFTVDSWKWLYRSGTVFVCRKKNEKKKNAVEPQKKEEIKIQKKQLAKQKETINKGKSTIEVVEGGDYSNNDDFFSELNSMLGRNL